MKYCQNCGNQILDTDKYCNNCGEKIEQPKTRESSPYAIISLISGIIALVLCCSPWIAMIATMIAISTGIISFISQERDRGGAIAGICCGVICMILFILKLDPTAVCNSCKIN